jgi:hypothetical protein
LPGEAFHTSNSYVQAIAANVSFVPAAEDATVNISGADGESRYAKVIAEVPYSTDEQLVTCAQHKFYPAVKARMGNRAVGLWDYLMEMDQKPSIELWHAL